MNAHSEKQHSGDRLLEVIDGHLGLQQAEVARLLDVTPQRLSNWIKRGIPSGEIRKVSEALHVRRDFLELELGPVFDKGYDELQMGWQKGFAAIAERKSRYVVNDRDDPLLKDLIDTCSQLTEKQKRALVQMACSMAHPED